MKISDIHIECDQCGKDFALNIVDFRLVGDDWDFWVCPDCGWLATGAAHAASCISIKREK